MSNLGIVLFFVGAFCVYALITRHFMCEFRRGGKKWSRNKWVMFAYRMNWGFLAYSIWGRIWYFPKIRNVERKWLKEKLAASGETVSDKETNLFLELNARRNSWALAFLFLYVVFFGFAAAITKAIIDGAY